MKNKRLFLLPATIAAGFNLLGTNLQAGTIWDGGGTASNTNINTATNWDANVVNLLDGTTTATFGTGGSTATINVAANFTGIAINRDANFTIADGAGALTVGTGGITVTLPTTTGRTHTISESNLILNGNQTWSVTNNTGAAILRVSSAISELVPSTLSKSGGGILTLSGANSYSGTTTINAGGGTLRLENTGALGTSPLVQINNGILQLATNASFSGPNISIAGGTIVSDRLTTGAGVTHVLGNAAVSNTSHNFTMGSNVTSGDAAIQLGTITNAAATGAAAATLNPTTANLIVTGGYTTIAATGTNGLTLGGTAAANSMVGNIALGTRTTINVTKSGNSVWTLSGTNTGLNGTTSVTGGALITTNLAALPNSGAVTFNGGTIGAVMGTSPTNWSTSEVDTLLSTATKTSGAIGIDTTNAGLTQWTPFTTTNLGALGLTKLGTNTLTLDQGSNNYTGATTIAQGTLKLDVDHTLTGALNFGIANGTTSPTGTLDLATTNVNATFGGLNVRTNSATANSITIGTGKTLTLTGSAVSNVISVGTNAVGGVAKLQVTGAGTLAVNDVSRNIVVANTASSGGTSSAQMDLSGLSTFNATIANLYLGRPTDAVGAPVNGTPNDILTLAGSSTINATGSIAVGGSATGGATGISKIILGTATTLEAAVFAVGGARSSGTIEFNTGLTNPAVTIRGAGGAGTRTNIFLGDGLNASGIFLNNGGSNTSTGTMNFTGGTVTATVNNLLMATGSGVVAANRGRAIGNFTMDGASSNVDINTLVLAQNTNDDSAALVGGGNPASLGTFTVTNGTLQINTAMTLANDIDATATAGGVQNVQATFAVAGGNATIGALATPVNMILGNQVTAGNIGVITAAVSVTGGTLNVFGDIKEGNLGAGTITSSLALNGGTLDMKGNSIGISSALIDTLTFASGTLRNVATINGTSGLTKTTTGTLVIEGTNGYTGATQVSAGVLAVNGSLANTTTTVGNTATLRGSGSIGGSVTVQSGGTIAAGNSIESITTGALSLESGSTFAYEINNDAAAGVAGDLTAVTGNLTLDLGNLANLTIGELGAGTWTIGEKLTLISYTGTWNGGLFNYGGTLADDSSFMFSGMEWMFNYNDNVAGSNYTGDLTGSTFVTMTAIPEPNVAALLGGLGTLVLLRRRRSTHHVF